MDNKDEFRTILDKFAKTIDELNQFKTQAAEVLGSIDIIDDTVTRMLLFGKRIQRTLTEHKNSQDELKNTLNSFAESQIANTELEIRIEPALSSLTSSYDTILTRLNQLESSVIKMQSVIELQTKVNIEMITTMRENSELVLSLKRYLAT
ncbi:MAG: hypothetical protein LBF68_03740 [Christensenellaceae bacterium]|jgi:hypothetical protein|nr:hypothetical protein [Christensenellaceae bacterium]